MVDIDATLRHALNMLQAGRSAEALALAHRLVDQHPDDVRVLQQVAGFLHERAGRADEAIGLLKRAAVCAPANPKLRTILGDLFSRRGRYAEAAAWYRQALAISSDSVAALVGLSVALREQGQLDEAVELGRRVARLEPGNCGAHLNLGNLLSRQGRPAEAVESLRRAVTLEPHDPIAHHNLGMALFESAAFPESEAALRHAIRLKPDLWQARWSLAQLLLLLGRYDEGWAMHEWRLKATAAARRSGLLARPAWLGEPLHGRTLLVCPEQGLGDFIHFARFLPMIGRFGGRLVVECPAKLRRLIGTLDGIDQIVEEGGELPQFDCQIPIMSLGRIARVREGEFGPQPPYLKFPPNIVTQFGNEPLNDLRVAVTWAGNPRNLPMDRKRSMHLSNLRELLSTEGVRFYSVQTGEARRQLAEPQISSAIVDAADDADLAETAATLSQMDLTITVDTAIVHLAGALGVPTWLLVSRVPDWRWLLGRDDTPWYPSVRLFRQAEPGEWHGVVSRVRDELEALVHQRRSISTPRVRE